MIPMMPMVESQVKSGEITALRSLKRLTEYTELAMGCKARCGDCLRGGVAFRVGKHGIYTRLYFYSHSSQRHFRGILAYTPCNKSLWAGKNPRFAGNFALQEPQKDSNGVHRLKLITRCVISRITSIIHSIVAPAASLHAPPEGESPEWPVAGMRDPVRQGH